MSSRVGAIVSCGLAFCVTMGAPASHAQQAPTPAAAPSGAPRPDQFAGVWDYNADESTNAATGKTEQDPKSATQRSLAAARSNTPPPDTAGLGRAAGTAGSAGPDGDDPTAAFRGWSAAWARSAARDLLEVPEILKISVSSGAITIADDLDRARTYQTDGKKKKYQLGSAVFEAKTYWEGPRLRKDIESVNSFKMTETYFVSEDGSRLFVLIRVGDPSRARNAPVVGVNRVYDRVQR
jgi:hypothetical protein